MPFGAIVFLRTKFLEKLKKGWSNPLGLDPILVGGNVCLIYENDFYDFYDFYGCPVCEFYLEEYY